jgi:hypothetical protein
LFKTQALLARITRHSDESDANLTSSSWGTSAKTATRFEPIPPRLARNTIIESTFEVGHRFRCTMRVDCGQLDPGAVIRPEPGEWHPRMPERLDEEELADWRAGRDAVYQLAALTVGARLADADAWSCPPPPGVSSLLCAPGVISILRRHRG